MRFSFHLALNVLCLTLTAEAIAGCERRSKEYRVCVTKVNGMSFAIQACQAKEEEVQEAHFNAAFQRALRRLTPERQEELLQTYSGRVPALAPPLRVAHYLQHEHLNFTMELSLVYDLGDGEALKIRRSALDRHHGRC